jgi:hypothetical protein
LPRTNTIHISLPEDSGRITKSSVAWLYGAVVCSILRDVSVNFSLPSDVSKDFTYAIYTFFNLFEDDLRRSETLLTWLPILKDMNNYTYHGAAAINAIESNLCKNCSNKEKHYFVEMQISKEIPGKLECPKCGGNQGIKTALTVKHLHNVHDKLLKRLQGLPQCLPCFEECVKDVHKYLINENKEDFLKRFREYDALATKDLLSSREHYFMGHYDTAKKSKKRWCSIDEKDITNIEINDPRYYSQYKPLINESVNAFIHQSEPIDKNLTKAIQDTMASQDMLKELGWPERFIIDKIRADIIKGILVSIISERRADKHLM